MFSAFREIEYNSMEVSVYDTVFKKDNGNMVKFDIIVPASLKDLNKIYFSKRKRSRSARNCCHSKDDFGH